MKYISTFYLVLSLVVLSSCGGDDSNQNQQQDLAQQQQFQPLSTLTITNSLPANGNGDLTNASIRNLLSENGGENTLIITGNSGEADAIQHQVTVRYILYYQSTGYGMEQKADVRTVTHAWGTNLETPDIDGGISLCEANCDNIVMYPKQHTVVFSNLILGETANPSTFAGAIVYP